MKFGSLERLLLQIDGANLYAAAHALDINLDFRRLLSFFQKNATVVRALYYTPLVDGSPLQTLTDWLNYNGYSLVTCPAKEFLDSTGRTRIKGNIDIDIAVDAMQIANAVDHIVLFSGKGDFSPLIRAVQKKGKRVTVVSTLQTQPVMASDELRRSADDFIDLLDIKDEIARLHKDPVA